MATRSFQIVLPSSASFSTSNETSRASSWIASSSPSFRLSNKLSFQNDKLGYEISANSRKSGLSKRSLVKSQAAEIAVLDKPTAVVDNILNELHLRGDRLSEILCGSNIYLIGMMGCGKTTVGRIISESLGYYFFDSDTVVEQTVGTSVAEVFSKHGEATFRELETQAICNLSSMNGLIVATGGGAIIKPDNWKCMKNGVTVWLDVPLTDLASRVVNAGVGSRPLVDSGEDNLDQYSAALTKLSTIYQKRQHLYPQADLRLSFDVIASKYGVSSVASVTPNMIVLEMIKGLTEIVESKHMNDEYCKLGSSWADEEIYLPPITSTPAVDKERIISSTFRH